MSNLLPTSRRPHPTPVDASWGRLEQAYARALDGGEQIALMAIELSDVDPLGQTSGVGPWARLIALESVIRALPGAGGVLIAKRDERLVVLLPTRSLEQVEGLAAALFEAWDRLQSDGSLQCTFPVVGLAYVPEDAELHFETVVRVAEEGARLALFHDRGCTVHAPRYAEVEEEVRREVGVERATITPVERGATSGTPVEVRSLWKPAEHAPPAVNGVAAPEGEPIAGPSRNGEEAEIDFLRRRVAKLLQAVEASEQRVAVLENHRTGDTGIASIYRDVQGLTGGEEHFDRKSALLLQIFEANLALRSRPSSDRGGPRTTSSGAKE